MDKSLDNRQAEETFGRCDDSQLRVSMDDKVSLTSMLTRSWLSSQRPNVSSACRLSNDLSMGFMSAHWCTRLLRPEHFFYFGSLLTNTRPYFLGGSFKGTELSDQLASKICVILGVGQFPQHFHWLVR
jgi:hypothetical protein